MRFSPNVTGNYLGGLAAHNGGGDAVICGPRRLDWAALARRVNRLASAMIARGVRPGDKVAFLFHNTPEFIEVNFAAQVCGAVPVPVNYRFTALEVERQLRHSDAVGLLYDERWADAAEAAVATMGADAPWTVARRREHPSPYDELVAAGADDDPRVPTGWDDVAVMIYTGGTTGPPKGVMLTYGAHREMYAALLSQIITRGARLDLTDEQLQRVIDTMPVPGLRYLAPLSRSRIAKRVFGHPRTGELVRRSLFELLARPEWARVGYRFAIRYMTPSMPFFHDASYQMLMLGLMAGNLTFVLSDSPSFDPARVLETVEREQPFFLANVPTGWRKLVDHPDVGRRDLSSVRVAATGAGVCSAALKRRIMAAFPGVIIIDMLGQTEMTPITSFRIDASPEAVKDRSVGQAIVDARVVDAEGRALPTGETGEIWYRGATVMKGYYKDRDGTAEVTRDGWLRSGDLGFIDEEGELRIVDRLRECISTGGEKVFPLEVEEVLGQHPAVELCCVIGVPSEEWGEAVRAVVQLRPGQSASAEELAGFCRRRLAGYKTPRSVVVVTELPLSPVGKVLRAKVRELHGAA